MLQTSVFTCERNPRVSTSTATEDPRQDIRGGGKVVVGISGYNLITLAFLKNVCQHKERKPDLSGESLCGKVHPLTRKTSKYAFWKELFGRGTDRRQ